MNEIIKVKNNELNPKTSTVEVLNYLGELRTEGATVFIKDALGIVLEIPLNYITMTTSPGDCITLDLECYGPIQIHNPEGVKIL